MISQDKNITPADYDDYWQKVGVLGDVRVQEVLSLCPRGLKTIDLGGGSGYVAMELGAKLVDWSPVAVQQAKELGVNAVCSDLLSFLKDCRERYELVILADVLEEMKQSETEALLDGVKKICSKYFVISTPTHENYITITTHQVIYDKPELFKMLEDRGFNKDEIVYYKDRLISRYICA